MIDLHCHILDGVDDGAATPEESLTMAALAAKDGIRTIVATPHINAAFHDVALINHRVEKLNGRIEAARLPVAVLKGGEVAFHFLSDDLTPYRLADSTSVLVEFPHNFLPATAAGDLRSLCRQGLRPVIAHPERNESVIANPDSLLRLLGPDIVVQLTAGSVTGDFGPTVRACALHLLQQDITCCLASDAHSAEQRPPLLGKAVKKIAKVVGKKRAHAMVQDIPERLLHNRPLR